MREACFGKRLVELLVLAMALSAPVAHAAAPTETGALAVAWQAGGSDAEVDRAFAAARAAGKPVFLYWGAVWCPPCNQVKATLFHRPDFIERSRAFVPVYVDGDKPGAQKVAARFQVQGYPTMVLFKPDGTEVTRLPGEVDPERYLLALGAALDAQVPVRELVARALRGEPLQPQQWRLLAYYSWDTDQSRIFAEKDLSARLADLAEHAPAPLADVRDRLALKALAAVAGTPTPPPNVVAGGRRALDHLLDDPTAAAVQLDLLTGYGSDFVTLLAPATEQRRALAARMEAALDALVKSNALSKAVQIDALDARVSLWKLMAGTGQLTADQRREMLVDVARVVSATTDRYERQAVVPSAGHVLREAGLVHESDELLTMELPRAVAPYYHMLGLAGNAKARKDYAAALHWYEEAWRDAEGPATRLQWGTGFIASLIELAPTDVARIEQAAHKLIAELQPTSETFYERNERALARLSARFVEWEGKDAARRHAVANIRRQLAAVCGRLKSHDTGHTNCMRVLPAA